MVMAQTNMSEVRPDTHMTYPELGADLCVAGGFLTQSQRCASECGMKDWYVKITEEKRVFGFIEGKIETQL